MRYQCPREDSNLRPTRSNQAHFAGKSRHDSDFTQYGAIGADPQGTRSAPATCNEAATALPSYGGVQ